jgi:hypothetical protein
MFASRKLGGCCCGPGGGRVPPCWSSQHLLWCAILFVRLREFLGQQLSSAVLEEVRCRLYRIARGTVIDCPLLWQLFGVLCLGRSGRLYGWEAQAPG